MTPNQISSVSAFVAAAAAEREFHLAAPSFGRVSSGWRGPLHMARPRWSGRRPRPSHWVEPRHRANSSTACATISVKGLIYIALAIVLQRTMGGWAYGASALAAAASHTVQANAYESGRKTYRRWVYGAAWMRQRPDFSRSWAGLANRAYLGAANVFSPS